MALVKCRECSREISAEAKSCPGCGAKPKQPIGRFGVISLLILGAFIYTSVTKSPEPAAPALTDAQIAAKAAAEVRYQATVHVLASIKAAMREPDSLKWDRILANEDGTVVCVTYRARNGFGGMAAEHAAFAKKVISTSNDTWNKNCADKPLYEMKHAKYGL